MKHLWVTIILLFFALSPAQDMTNTFTYTVEGAFTRTINHQSAGAISGAFYLEEGILSPRWQVILGFGSDEEVLEERVRITIIPSSTSDDVSASATFLSANTIFALRDDNLDVISSSHGSFNLDHLNGTVRGSFAFSFAGTTCVNGSFNINMTPEAESLLLAVGPGEPEPVLARQLAGYNALDTNQKLLVEAGGFLYWDGYSYLQSSPVSGSSSNHQEIAFANACEVTNAQEVPHQLLPPGYDPYEGFNGEDSYEPREWSEEEKDFYMQEFEAAYAELSERDKARVDCGELIYMGAGHFTIGSPVGGNRHLLHDNCPGSSPSD